VVNALLVRGASHVLGAQFAVLGSLLRRNRG